MKVIAILILIGCFALFAGVAASAIASLFTKEDEE